MKVRRTAITACLLTCSLLSGGCAFSPKLYSRSEKPSQLEVVDAEGRVTRGLAKRSWLTWWRKPKAESELSTESLRNNPARSYTRLTDGAPADESSEMPYQPGPSRSSSGTKAVSFLPVVTDGTVRAAGGEIMEVTPPIIIGSPTSEVSTMPTAPTGEVILEGDGPMIDGGMPIEEPMLVESDGSMVGGMIAAWKGKKAEKKALADAVPLSFRDQRARGDIGNNPCVPRELRMASHPLYVVEPPDVLYIEAFNLLPERDVVGERLVRQDGTLSLGYYGQIHVAGLTLDEIENKLRKHLGSYLGKDQSVDIYVDVAAFNSKVYYVLGQVQQTGRLPITGKETVLDAITLAGGLTNFADVKQIHVARPNPGGGCDQVLFVDYRAITECGDTKTNYQLLPGDRVMVPATSGFKVSVFFDNFLSPIERVVGIAALTRFVTSN